MNEHEKKHQELHQDPELEGLEDDFADLVALMAEDREAQDPGDHFFEALHDDILAELEPRGSEVLGGGRVVDVRPLEESPSLWERLRGFWGGSPTVAYAGVMALALLGIVLWSNGQKSATSVSPDAGDFVAASEDLRPPANIVPHSLDKAEIEELRMLASRMKFDIDSENSWLDDDVESLDFEGSLEGLSDDELEGLERLMDRTLQEG